MRQFLPMGLTLQNNFQNPGRFCSGSQRQEVFYVRI